MGATKINDKGREVEVTRLEGYYSKAELDKIDRAVKLLSDKAGAKISRKAFTERATLKEAERILNVKTPKSSVSSTENAKQLKTSKAQ